MDLEGIEQPTVFDAKVRSLRLVLEAERPAVRHLDLAASGDLLLALSGDVELKIVPPIPAEQEAWRFFDRLGNHFVYP